MSTFHDLKIVEIHNETADSVRIDLSVPSNLSSEFKYKAGQYINIESSIDGEKVRRSYSLCSAPDDSNIISIGVKEVAGGRMSPWLTRELKAGDTLSVTAPEGRFTPIDRPEAIQYIFFAGGSGVTPILSMAKWILANRANDRILMFYGNKTPATEMFSRELSALKKAYSERFNLNKLYSRSEDENEQKGRIDAPQAQSLLRQFADLSVDPEFYICGPTGMMEAVAATLKNLRVEEERVHAEWFSAPDGIDEGEAVETMDGTVEYEIILDDEKHSFTADANKSILDAGLDAGLDMPYSCRGGVCSSCIGQIKSGNVDMKLNYVLTDEEVEDGLSLCCQSFPKTGTVVVDLDV